MKLLMNTLALCTLLACGPAALAQHAGHAQPPGAPAAAPDAAPPATPYAGLQARDIKALSAEETQRLMQGHGMGLALAAELNGYPGPTHVLELAGPLGLTPAQREQTQALMDRHKAQARELGGQLVQAERALDRAFASGQITVDALARLTTRIGELQGSLRNAHLRTHLEQAALLSPQQVGQYQQLRGYRTADAGGRAAHAGHGVPQ